MTSIGPWGVEGLLRAAINFNTYPNCQHTELTVETMTPATQERMESDYLHWATIQVSDSRMERAISVSSANQVCLSLVGQSFWCPATCRCKWVMVTCPPHGRREYWYATTTVFR